MLISSRRKFLASLPGILMSLQGVTGPPEKDTRSIMTVSGPVDADTIGNTLIHEHILVDFIGAKDIDPERWDREEVIKKVLPYLRDVKKAGCQTLIDCTPQYLGRDPLLLKSLATLSELNIITNTGYYGGSDHKFLPGHAFTESPQALADRWTDEWKKGIDTTSIKPGFIKISVNPGPLSDISKKLVHAAALTHLATGLTIASHTGPAKAAFEEIDLLKEKGIHPGAFIWVHAQNETHWPNYVKAAREGAWISLDGLSEDNIPEYINRLLFLKKEKCLERTLISHDAGWYDPSHPHGGNIRGYTTLFKKFLPALKQKHFEAREIEQLVRKNPQNAFEIRIKRLKK